MIGDGMEDNDPFEEDIHFDQAGLLGGKPLRPKHYHGTTGVLPTFMLFCRSVFLCVTFVGLGLCSSVSRLPLINVQKLLDVPEWEALHTFTAHSIGAFVGGLLGSKLFDVYNRQFLMFISLVWVSVSVAELPFTLSYSLWWMRVTIVAVSAGIAFLFTGGNVLCLDLWGRQGGGGALQALHFSFSLGAFIAPVIIHPFLMDTPALPSTLTSPSELLLTSQTATERALIRIPRELLLLGRVSERDAGALNFAKGIDQFSMDELINLTQVTSTVHKLNKTDVDGEESANATFSTSFLTTLTAADEEASTDGLLPAAEVPKPARPKPSFTGASVKDEESSILKDQILKKAQAVALEHKALNIKPSDKTKVEGVIEALNSTARENNVTGLSSLNDAQIKEQKLTFSVSNYLIDVSNATQANTTADTDQLSSNVNKADMNIGNNKSDVNNKMSLEGNKVIEESKVDDGKKDPRIPTPSLVTMDAFATQDSTHIETILNFSKDKAAGQVKSSVATAGEVRKPAAAGDEVKIATVTAGNIKLTLLEEPSAAAVKSAVTPVPEDLLLLPINPSLNTTEDVSIEKPSVGGTASSNFSSVMERPRQILHSIVGLIKKPGTFSNISEERSKFIDGLTEKFKGYGVTKIHLAFIFIALFVFLNSLIFVCILCHNPREPRSKQEEGSLDQSGRARHAYFLVIFSFFMFTSEALEGAIHHMLASNSRSTGLSILDNGVDGPALFWGLVCLVRFLCVMLSGCIHLKPGKILGVATFFAFVGTIFLSIGSFGKDDFLWTGIILASIGIAPTLPTSLLWMSQHMIVTHRMCALMIVLTSVGNSLTHSGLTYIASRSHVYSYILVTMSMSSVLLLVISWFIIYTSISKSSSRRHFVSGDDTVDSVSHDGYRLARQHEDDDNDSIELQRQGLRPSFDAECEQHRQLLHDQHVSHHDSEQRLYGSPDLEEGRLLID